MQHIDSFELGLFRGFHNIRLKDLGRINLIVGPNNCGKSTVLEALYLLCRPMAFDRWRLQPKLRCDSPFMPGAVDINWFFPQSKNDSVDEIFLKVESQIFPFRELHVTKETLEKTSLVKKGGGLNPWAEPTYGGGGIGKRFNLMEIIQQYPDQEELELNFIDRKQLLAPSMATVADATDISETELAEKNLVRVRDEVVNYRVSVSHIKTPKRLVRNIIPFGANQTACRDEEEKYFTDLDFSHVFVQPKSIWSEFEEFPSTLTAHIDALRERETVIRLLKEFDPEINDFKTRDTTSDYPVYLEHANFEKRVPLSCFGDGMRRAFVMIASAAAARDGILLIDEVESGLHFTAMLRTMKALIAAARAFNVQIFITTHSLEAIDAFLNAARENESLEDVVGFSLDIDKTKQPKRFDGLTMQRLRLERGFEVR